MPHTYLLEKGNWDVRGHFTNALHTQAEVKGTTRVDHLPEHWTSDSELNLKNTALGALMSHYRFAPLEKNADSTTWVAEDPLEGTIRGTLCIVDDSLISTFRSDATNYHGVDVMRKLKDNAYQSRGFVMKDGERLSSWQLSFSRSAWKLEADAKKKGKSPARQAGR